VTLAIDIERRVEHGTALELRRISKRFGMVNALVDVSLALHMGEVLCLIGDNGAGKSTLVGVMSGTLRPDDGDILVHGRHVSFADPSRARAAGIETVFQNLSLIPTLTIAENIFLRREQFAGKGIGQRLHVMDRRRMRREVQALYARLGLDLPAPETKVAALSGGQRQAVAIARAVKWGNEIVLLDEPAAALGVRQTEMVLSLVERLRNAGIATVFISHNMDHVVRVADRVAVMRLGRKVFEGSAAELDAHDLVSLITAGNLAAERQRPDGGTR
jgi:simple sugar transport system ATP-binding protein